jgi:hypothetical protein
MLGNYGSRHTLRICNTYCFSTARMVTWTRLSVRLYVRCLSRLRYLQHGSLLEPTRPSFKPAGAKIVLLWRCCYQCIWQQYVNVYCKRHSVFRETPFKFTTNVRIIMFDILFYCQFSPHGCIIKSSMGNCKIKVEYIHNFMVSLRWPTTK